MIRIALLGAGLLLAACSAPSPGAGTQPAASAGAERHLPPDSLIVLPEAAGWNTAALAEVVAYAGAQNTTGFLIIDDGRIIADHNWPLPPDAEAFRANFTHGETADGVLLEDVASQQKALIAVLAGIAVDRGFLDTGKPVSAYAGAGWSKAAPEQEAAITVRHLLEMTSGLGEDLAFRAPAGSTFFYNTPAYAILKPVLEAASGQTLDAITGAWLTEPLLMTDTAWRPRPAAFANVGNPTGLVTTARDLARLGQFILDGGLAPDRRRVMTTASLDAMLKPTATNPAYGQLWWINGGAYVQGVGDPAPRRDGAFIPAAPSDLVVATGAQDRRLFVVPSRKLIVARTGRAAPDRDFNQQLWLLLAKAMPQR